VAQLLKQSTAVTVRLGCFVDATNGVTPETGITLGAADQAEILKHSGATVDISGATWAAVTGASGWYDLSLTTSHTDTLGMMTVIVQDESVCLPVWKDFMVVPANVYESLINNVEFLSVTTLENDVTIAGTTITVKKKDGSTTQYTRTGTFTPGADVLTGLD
jgi:hypothetical protein